MPKQDFPQTELQEKIRSFWSARGWSKVTAILGNLNVAFHKENPKYDELGLCYQYLEQFWNEAQKEKESEVQELKDKLSESIKELRDNQITIIQNKNEINELIISKQKLQYERNKLNEKIEKLQKENEGLKISNNQMKSSAIMKENAELHNIILQKDNEWEEKIDKLFDTMKDRSQNKWADDQIINFFKINLKRNSTSKRTD